MENINLIYYDLVEPIVIDLSKVISVFWKTIFFE